MSHVNDASGATPGLHVALRTSTVDVLPAASVAVEVEVENAARPLRVAVYLDGDLVETWATRQAHHEVRVAGIRGRHVITARAVDAAGRWGGASVLVDAAAA